MCLRRLFVREAPSWSGAPLMAHLKTDPDGDDIMIVARASLETWVEGFPRIIDAVRRGKPGFVPVVVHGPDWGAVRWMALDRTNVAPPPALYELHEDLEGRFDHPVEDLCQRTHRASSTCTRPR